MPATNDTTTGDHGQNARTLHSANAPETSPDAAVSTTEPTTLPRPPHSVLAGSTRECIDALVAAVAAARAERNGDTRSIAPTTLGAMWLALDDVEAALATTPAPTAAGEAKRAVEWPSGALNRADTLRILVEHNAWRRGADGPQTDPRMLGLALDAAISAISAPAASVEVPPPAVMIERDAAATPAYRGARMPLCPQCFGRGVVAAKPGTRGPSGKVSLQCGECNGLGRVDDAAHTVHHEGALDASAGAKEDPHA